MLIALLLTLVGDDGWLTFLLLALLIRVLPVLLILLLLLLFITLLILLLVILEDWKGLPLPPFLLFPPPFLLPVRPEWRPHSHWV